MGSVGRRVRLPMRGLTGLLWVAGLVAVAMLAVRWLLARGAAEYRRAAEELERVSSLSVQEAAVKARALLSDPTVFHVVPAAARDSATLQQLAPQLRNVLAEYETIELLKEPRAILERSALGPSEFKQRFVRIGRAAEGSDAETEVIVRPGEETVYELAKGEEIDPTSGTFKSVYHWLIAIAQEEPSIKK
jgi:hypothetical protein